MNHKGKALLIQISVSDITEQVCHQIRFLQEVDDITELKTYEGRQLAAYRYEKYWLPLLSRYPKTNLVGPIDVEWMWHCHMLAPINYIQDCTKLLGKVTDHKLRNKQDRNECENRARQLWLQMFADEPFDVEYTDNFVEKRPKISNFKSCFSYDIIAASERQSNFYYNVSLPHFMDRRFLQSSLDRYKQFLYIKRQFPDSPLVPCYDIDLVWHTHMLNPVKYANDTIVICGNVLHHDDTPTENGVGTKIHSAGEKTMEHWNAIFRERFKIPGTLNRGESLKGNLAKFDKDEVLRTAVIEKGTISINTITLSGPSLTKKKLGDMYLVFKTTMHKMNSTVLEGAEAEFTSGDDAQNNAVWPILNASFEVRENDTLRLSLELWKRKFMYCLTREKQKLFTCITDFKLSFFEDNSSVELSRQQRFDNFTVHINSSVAQTTQRVELRLKESPFTEVRTVEEMKRHFWYKKEDECVSYLKETCITTCPTLWNRNNSFCFSVPIFHCASLLTSQIEVQCDTRVVVNVKLISNDHLPSQSQVGDDVPTVDLSKGERALLIQHNNGDFAIVIGKWAGYKRGKEGKIVQRCIKNDKGENIVQEYRVPSHEENTGHLDYRIYYLPSCKKSTILPAHLQVDFYKGVIKINADIDHIAENIGLAFSVALLHVLCVPRRRDWRQGYAIDHYFLQKFLVVSGLHMITPSNHYITTLLGGIKCLGCGMNDQDNQEPNDALTENISFGCDGLTQDLEPAGCIGIDVKENAAMWSTKGRREENGDITPLNKCGRFAKTCYCDVCNPRPPSPPKTIFGHEMSCRCRVCACGGMCMHTASTR